MVAKAEIVRLAFEQGELVKNLERASAQQSGKPPNTVVAVKEAYKELNNEVQRMQRAKAKVVVVGDKGQGKSYVINACTSFSSFLQC